MPIAILVGRNEDEKNQFHWFIADWKKSLLALQPDLDIRIWPDIGNPDEVDYAMVWHPAHGVLRKLTRLKVIASLGAGVDHVFLDKELPAHIPIVRVIDPYMKNDIVQYVVSCVLHHVKRMDHWQELQRQKKWSKQPPFNLADKTVGVMGVGILGGKAVEVMHEMGLHVIGWSNSPKKIAGITHYHGKNQLPDFLAQTDILACMLPLTDATRNILNRDTFSLMPEGAYIINVGRGEHLVEADLLAALASGQLSGAALDVFRQEPLPPDHPFWLHDNIRITPHIASVTNPATAAPQVLENYRRMQEGRSLINEVDLTKGY